MGKEMRSSAARLRRHPPICSRSVSAPQGSPGCWTEHHLETETSHHSAGRPRMTPEAPGAQCTLHLNCQSHFTKQELRSSQVISHPACPVRLVPRGLASPENASQCSSYKARKEIQPRAGRIPLPRKYITHSNPGLLGLPRL